MLMVQSELVSVLLFGIGSRPMYRDQSGSIRTIQRRVARFLFRTVRFGAH